MLKILISVKDTVSEVFNDPRAEINAASAIRSFTLSVQESPHKDDFALYQIGTFDTTNGAVSFNEPLRLYTGHDVKTHNVVDLIQKEKQE